MDTFSNGSGVMAHCCKKNDLSEHSIIDEQDTHPVAQLEDNTVRIKFKKMRYLKVDVIVVVIITLFTLINACDRNRNNKNQEDGLSEETSQNKEARGMMDGENGMMHDGMMNEEMRKAMMSEGMGPDMMDDMMTIRQLLMNHEQIERRVENLSNGVKTWTTSANPKIAAAIQRHVRQMKDRMSEEKPIRQMDPVFRELFENADKIDMKLKDIENGIVVLETSEDPQVVKLIQQHANKVVSEFVDQGMQRAMRPTPLPKEYEK